MEVVGAWYIYNNILLLSIGNAARCSYLHRWLYHWYSSSMHRHSISSHWILCKCKCFTFVPADPLGVKVLCAWVDVNVHMHWCQCVVIYQSILKCYWSLNVEVYLHHSWFIYCQSHVGSGWFKVTKLVASLRLCSFQVWDWSSRNLLDFSWLRGPWFFLGKFLTYSFKLLYL